MDNESLRKQAEADAVMIMGSGDPTLVSEPQRMLAMALRGMAEPRDLSDREMKSVCTALVVHFAQMGITPSA